MSKKIIRFSTRHWLWLLWAVWVLVVAVVQLWRLNHFAYTGFDLAIYTQAFWSLTHGSGFWSSIQDHNYLSDHLEPILMIFWPFMKLWFSPLWLLWGQTLVLASSIFPLYRLARRTLPERQALLLPAAFLLHTTVWNTALVEFHALALAAPLILWACVFLVEGKVRWWQWSLLLVALSLVREEMGLVVIGFGVLALIRKRGWGWWIPAVLIGLGWTGLAQWIQSWFVEGYRYTYYFPWFSLIQEGHYLEGIRVLLGLLFRVDTVKMILEAFLGLGLVWILAIDWLIPAIPVIVSFALLDASVSHALIEGYHGIVPFTLFWAALPFGLQRTQKLLSRFFRSGPPIPYGLLLGIVIPAMLSTWVVLWLAYPKGSSEYQPEDLAVLFDQIQPSDSVAASPAFLPTLAARSSLQTTWYIFRGQDEFLTAPYELNPDTYWILFDTHEFLDLRTQRDEFWIEHQRFLELLQAEFTPVASVGSIVLFQRVDQQPINHPNFQTILTYTSGTPDVIPEALTKPFEERPKPVVLPGPETTVIGNHLYLDLYVFNPERWAALEQQFITPVITLKANNQEISLPVGYGLITPYTVQEGDRMKMDIVLPERMLGSGRSKWELTVRGELIQLEGLSYGRAKSITHRTTWVETFLDKTLTFE